MKNSGKLPGFGLSPIMGETEDVSNIQMAAIIYALDVPLKTENGYTVQAGHGINGNRLTFHFFQKDPAGYKPKKIAEWAKDKVFLANNPQHPVAACVRAFDAFHEFTRITKKERPSGAFTGSVDTVRVTNTRKAAAMSAMGHPMMGIRWSGPCCIFHFPATAGVDSAMYDRPTIYAELPHHNLSYVRAALLSHESMIRLAESANFARVEHRGKIAIIGRDVDKKGIDILDKILHQKKPI